MLYYSFYDFWLCLSIEDPMDTSAEEKEIIDLTKRLISAIGAKDKKEYTWVCVVRSAVELSAVRFYEDTLWDRRNSVLGAGIGNKGHWVPLLEMPGV